MPPHHLIELLSFWHGLGPETKGALIQTVGTCIAAAGGFVAVVRQIRSQSRQTREAVAENERRKLKAKLYEDAVAITRSMSNASIELSTYVRSMSFSLITTAHAYEQNIPTPPPSARWPSFMNLYYDFTGHSLRFVFLIEQNQFVDPRIIVFRSAINCVSHNLRDLLFRQASVEVMRLLPVDNAAGGVFAYKPPSVDEAIRAQTICDNIVSQLSEADSYGEDFLVEMQNVLLSDLFGTKVKHRVPIDPHLRVVSLEQFDELDRWFNNETPWGKERLRVDAETKERFHPTYAGA